MKTQRVSVVSVVEVKVCTVPQLATNHSKHFNPYTIVCERKHRTRLLMRPLINAADSYDGNTYLLQHILIDRVAGMKSLYL